MPQKWVDVSSGFNIDRLAGVNNASIQLTDGIPVWLETDGNASVLLKYGATDHNSVAGTIATVALPFVPTMTAGQAITIFRDSLDNLCVVGRSIINGNFVAQGFTKGTGYSWTAHTAFDVPMSGTRDIVSFAAAWCNTGTGTNSKGHFIVFGITSNNNGAKYAVCDMGAVLAGTGTLVTASGAPSSLPHVPSIEPLDLDPDGFGALAGLVFACDNTTSTLQIGKWAVNTSGALSTDSSLATGVACGSLIFGSKLRCIRSAANVWSLVFPSTSAGRYMIARYSATAQLTAPTDSGAPVNMPLNSSGGGWDAVLDPVVATKVWIIAIGTQTGGQQQVYRLGCAVGSGVVWDAAVTSDDLLTNCFATQSSIRAVKKPGGAYVDWQAFVQTAAGNWALDGDYAIFPLAPNAPTLMVPASGIFQDVSGGTTFTAAYNSTDGLNQNAYALRLKIGAGAYRYWRASDATWQAAIVWNAITTAPGAPFSVIAV